MKRTIMTVCMAIMVMASMAVVGCNAQSGSSAQASTGDSGSGGASVVDVINDGFSARGFTDEQVSDELVKTILESGNNAPSARNLQPWRFTVIRDVTKASAIVNIATEGTVVIVISGTNEAQEGVNVDYDCALATQNMYLAAQSLGLGAHIYTGPINQVNAGRDELEIPEGYDAVAVLCIGYIENPADAISSASTRNNLDEVVNYVS